jgi:hypothetical protein
MSDLYDAGQSPVRVAHRHLSENDWLYRVCLIVAPMALVGAVTTGMILVFSSAPAPLPPRCCSHPTARAGDTGSTATPVTTVADRQP